MTRDEYLKMFRENADMKNLLMKSTDASEKRMIKAYAEDFLLKIFDSVIDPLTKVIEKDPDVLNKVLTKEEEDLIMSGSI
jgi:hypothetical protein